MMPNIRVVLLGVLLCFAAFFSFACVQEGGRNPGLTNPTETASDGSKSGSSKGERSFVAADLGEMDDLSRKFFPESRINRWLVRRTSVSLSEVTSNAVVDENKVVLTLLPVRTQNGRVIRGEDVIFSIQKAYEENVLYFDCNLIDSSSEALEVRLTFDREPDFEKKFSVLPIYPVSRLMNEDNDSFGEYRAVTVDTVAQRIELVSETAKQFPQIVIVHNDFETAKAAFQSGDIDILYLPHSNAAKLWAETTRGVSVLYPSNLVYMLGFGAEVPYEHRVRLAASLDLDEWIGGYFGGFAERAYFPAAAPIPIDPSALPKEGSDPIVLKYLCFVDSDWSYSLYNHLKRNLPDYGIELDGIFTDFKTMLNIGKAESSDYVYAFGWDLSANTDLSELLGESFGGAVLDEGEVERYFEMLPVIPLVSPYDYYLLKSNRFQSLIE